MPCESIWDCWSATQSALPKALSNNNMDSQIFISISKKLGLNHVRKFKETSTSIHFIVDLSEIATSLWKQTPLTIGVDADRPLQERLSRSCSTSGSRPRSSALAESCRSWCKVGEDDFQAGRCFVTNLHDYHDLFDGEFMIIHDEFIHFLMSLGILPLEVLEQVGADQLIGGAPLSRYELLVKSLSKFRWCRCLAISASWGKTSRSFKRRGREQLKMKVLLERILRFSDSMIQ